MQALFDDGEGDGIDGLAEFGGLLVVQHAVSCSVRGRGLFDGHDDVAVFVNARGGTRIKHQRGVGLLDDCRAFDDRPKRQGIAIVDAGLPPLAVEVDIARARFGCRE